MASRFRRKRVVAIATIGSLFIFFIITQIVNRNSGLRNFERIQEESLAYWKAEAEQCLRLAEGHESLAESEETAANELERHSSQYKTEVTQLRVAAAGWRADATFRRQRAAYAAAKAGLTAASWDSSKSLSSRNGLYVPPDRPEPVGTNASP